MKNKEEIKNLFIIAQSKIELLEFYIYIILKFKFISPMKDDPIIVLNNEPIEEKVDE